MEIKDFIRYFYKRIWIILTSLVLCSALSGLLTYFNKVSYVSTPKIIAGPQSVVSKDGKFVTNLIYVLSDLIENDYVVSRLSQETGLNIDKDSIKGIVSFDLNDQHQRMYIIVRSTDRETVRLIADKLPDIIANAAQEFFYIDNLMVIKSDKIVVEGKDYRKNIISGAVAGVGLGFFIIFLILIYDDVIRGRRDIKRLFGIEYLGLINSMGNNRKYQEDNLSLLCTKIVIKSSNASIKAIANIAMGTDNNEYILNLTKGLTSIGKRILAVEFDRSTKALVSKIKGQAKQGIGDLLKVNSVPADEIIYSTDIVNLDIVPFGTQDDISLTDLVNEKLQDFVMHVKDKYDLILFDIPYNFGMDRILAVANACDSSVIFIKDGGVKVKDAESVIENLKDSNIDLMGYSSVV